MRIYSTALIALLFIRIGIATAQPTQIFLPLQKPANRKLVLPVSSVFPIMPTMDSVKILSPRNTLPLNFYSSHLGVACKMELQLEKQIKLPLRIRLGSKDQVDYLEGKYSQHR